jgi:hypothetical protein
MALNRAPTPDKYEEKIEWNAIVAAVPQRFRLSACVNF